MGKAQNILTAPRNYQIWFFQKLWNLEEYWQRYCQNKTLTFLQWSTWLKLRSRIYVVVRLHLY